MTRFLIDACVHGMIATRLRDLGADIALFPGKPGAPDTEVLAAAFADGRVLLTSDKGFGDLVFVQRLPCLGAVLIRMKVNSNTDADVAAAIIVALPTGGLGAFTTIDSSGIRSRPIPPRLA